MEPVRLAVDERTFLRSVAESDVEALFAVVDANRAHLRRWLPWLDEQTSTETMREFVARSGAAEEEGSGAALVIDHEGVVCGVLGYNAIHPQARSCEIGYWISEERQGRGIVTRCVARAVRHAFEALDCNRIDMHAAVGNARSRAIAGRLGFREIGILPDAEWLYDHYVDAVLYCLLRRDWRPPA